MMLSGKQLVNPMNKAVGLAAECHLTSSHVVLPTSIVGFFGGELERLNKFDIPNFLVHPKPMQPNYPANGSMSFYCSMTLKFIRDSW
jgi:hypothetical protein